MSIELANAFKVTQLRLAEADLYKGKIDGVYGGGTVKGLNLLLTPGKATEVVSLFPLTLTDPKVVFSQLQTSLSAMGFNCGKVDGLWGNRTAAALADAVRTRTKAFDKKVYGPAWSIRVDKEFISLVQQWVGAEGRTPETTDWLMSVMGFESGYTYRPDKQNNGGSKAFGLLQFMDSAAEALNIPLATIVKMEQHEQLVKAVFPYFLYCERTFKKRLNSLQDYYFAVLRPKSIGMSSDSPLFTKPSLAYTQNRGLDLDNDGVVRAGDVSKTIWAVYVNGMNRINRSFE